MKLVYKYILNQFLSTTISLFFVLFMIVSMVFFIQLARITSNIEITFLEFLKLYSFMLPRILIFTLPIAFFISLTLSFFRLSKENESIVLFALGLSPKYLAIFFIKIASLLSFFMLLTSLIFIPIAFELQDNFVDYKKTKIKFNYKSGEFGQNFLDWMIFIDKEEDGIYKNIIMYHPKKNQNDKEQLLIANQGNLEQNKDVYSFRLKNGKMYNFENNESIFLGEFSDLVVNTKVSNSSLETKKFYEYWNDIFINEKRAKEFVIYVCIAIFPLASVLFALSFGIVTYRYEKGHVYFGMLFVICSYFGLLSSFYKNPVFSVFIIFSSFFIISIFCFKKMILSRY